MGPSRSLRSLMTLRLRPLPIRVFTAFNKHAQIPEIRERSLATRS